MKTLRLALVALVALLLAPIAVRADPLPGYRTVAIPFREHGYHTFASRRLSSQAELDAFLRTVKAKRGWNGFAAFEKALADARINWRRESLVLLTHTESSGSVSVVARTPRQKGSTLTITLDRTVPEVGTADMAYYCYAVVVAPATIRVVELTAGGNAMVSVKVPQ